MVILREIYKKLPCPGVIVKRDDPRKNPSVECGYNYIEECGDRILFYNKAGIVVKEFKGELGVGQEVIWTMNTTVYVVGGEGAMYYIYP